MEKDILFGPKHWCRESVEQHTAQVIRHRKQCVKAWGRATGLHHFWVSDVVQAGLWAGAGEGGPRKASSVQLLFFHCFEKQIFFPILFLEHIILDLALPLCACYSRIITASALWAPYRLCHKPWWYLTKQEKKKGRSLSSSAHPMTWSVLLTFMLKLSDTLEYKPPPLPFIGTDFNPGC